MTKKPARKIRRVLITGITGSGGSYLADHVLEHHPGVEVHGAARWRTASSFARKTSDKVRMHECDLTDFSSVLRALQNSRPDAIFHIASHANVRASFDTPLAVLQNNVMGTANLLESVRVTGQDPWFQLCSTSEVYGQVDPKYIPITEETPLNPVSPYAVSKTAQDLLGYSYFKSYGMRVIRTRMFTYFTPRRTDLFATAFARQVARIELGLQKELVHGNLDSVRTFIDVRDACRAYWDAIVLGAPGEVYNIGGNTTMTVGDCLKKLVALAKKKIPTREAASLRRPVDVTLQIPCVDKFMKATGWKPKYGFDESLGHLLDHWRIEAAREG